MKDLIESDRDRICEEECGGVSSSLCATPDCPLYHREESSGSSVFEVLGAVLLIMVLLALCTWAQAILGISIPFID